MVIEADIAKKFIESDAPGAKVEYTGNILTAKIKLLEAIAATLGLKVVASSGDLYILRVTETDE